jgi:hypothetical protein
MAKTKEKLYYSIRVVRAKSQKEAVNKIIEQAFEDSDEICDVVKTKRDLERIFKKRKQ